MGFFDKAKQFLTGYGLKVQITEIERQNPQEDEVYFPVKDSVLKGNYRIFAEQDCTILQHKHEFLLRYTQPDNSVQEIILDESIHDEDSNSSTTFPYDMEQDQEIEDSFVLNNINIPAALRDLGISNIRKVIDNPDFELILKVAIDVKGSPVDATDEVKIQFTND